MTTVIQFAGIAAMSRLEVESDLDATFLALSRGQGFAKLKRASDERDVLVNPAHVAWLEPRDPNDVGVG
jgi:hypothetical protein